MYTYKLFHIPMPLCSFVTSPPQQSDWEVGDFLVPAMAGRVSWNWDILRRSYRGAKRKFFERKLEHAALRSEIRMVRKRDIPEI